MVEPDCFPSRRLERRHERCRIARLVSAATSGGRFLPERDGRHRERRGQRGQELPARDASGLEIVNELAERSHHDGVSSVPGLVTTRCRLLGEAAWMLVTNARWRNP